jgi:phosphoglycolate phosphatase
LPEPDYVGTGSNAFGKPRLLKDLLAASDISPANAIYVVDEVRDIEAARSVGVRCIAVTWGYNERRILEAASPDVIVDEPGELVAAIDRLLTLR